MLGSLDQLIQPLVDQGDGLVGLVDPLLDRRPPRLEVAMGPEQALGILRAELLIRAVLVHQDQEGSGSLLEPAEVSDGLSPDRKGFDSLAGGGCSRHLHYLFSIKEPCRGLLASLTHMGEVGDLSLEDDPPLAVDDGGHRIPKGYLPGRTGPRVAAARRLDGRPHFRCALDLEVTSVLRALCPSTHVT